MYELKIALDSLAECLTYMIFALLTVWCASYGQGIVPWWLLLIIVMAVCMGMTALKYFAAVDGYGFFDEEDDEEEEERYIEY